MHVAARHVVPARPSPRPPRPTLLLPPARSHTVVTRLLPGRWVWKGPLHRACGIAYIISMLWCTATSLIIHNSGAAAPSGPRAERAAGRRRAALRPGPAARPRLASACAAPRRLPGLPPATLVSFVWVLGGLCVGWVIIKLHQSRMAAAAVARVQAQQLAAGEPAKDLGAALAAAAADIAASKGFAARFFSLKAAHGVIFFVSWINVSGRIFASDQRQQYTCFTYPVFKPIDSKHFAGAGAPLTLLPPHDPGFARLPWARLGLAGWALVMLFAPAAGAAAVGAAYSALTARAARKQAARTAPGGAPLPAAVAASKQELAAVEAGMGGKAGK